MLGTVSYGWITRRVSLGNIMRIGLIIETLTHLGLAMTTLPAVAMAIFFVFGAARLRVGHDLGHRPPARRPDASFRAASAA